MKLIVGLGNKGKEYTNTRHNIGFMVIDEYLKKYDLKLSEKKFKGEYFLDKRTNTIFLKPLTYMNLSGEAVLALRNYYKIDNEDILIIYDDLDLELGKIRLRPKGSCGGHNGMRNIISLLGSEKIKRLRIGISNNKEGASYVLGKFSKNELEVLDATFTKAVAIIDDFLKDNDMIKLMNKYNG